jgi:hypothetical protein
MSNRMGLVLAVLATLAIGLTWWIFDAPRADPAQRPASGRWGGAGVAICALRRKPRVRALVPLAAPARLVPFPKKALPAPLVPPDPDGPPVMLVQFDKNGVQLCTGHLVLCRLGDWRARWLRGYVCGEDVAARVIWVRLIEPRDPARPEVDPIASRKARRTVAHV